GRMFKAPNEAVAGQGFLDLMHIKVGAWISKSIDGVPVILHIVGRTIEPDNNGDVVDFGLDAVNHSGGAPPQLVCHLGLKQGMTPRQVVATLATNTMILTLLGVTSGTLAGRLIAPRLINMQGETSGIGSGIAVSLSVAAIAAIMAVALATAAAAALLLARRTT